jgi:hypothetical protein
VTLLAFLPTSGTDAIERLIIAVVALVIFDSRLPGVNAPAAQSQGPERPFLDSVSNETDFSPASGWSLPYFREFSLIRGIRP